MPVTLRDYQENALDEVRTSYGAGRKRPMLAAPTGAGKTVISAAIAEGAISKGNRVAFVVPYLSLIDQTVERFAEFGLHDVGVIQGAHEGRRDHAPVQVCSRDTLSARRHHPDVNLVVVDEAHLNSTFLFDWMAKDGGPRFLGLSATPWTKGLGKHYDDLIVCETTAGLIERGHLSPFRVFAPEVPDLSKVRKVAGEFHQGQLGDVMGDEGLVADVVQTWLKHADGRPTLVFAVDRAHAAKLQARFEAVGVPSGYVDAYTKADERSDVGRRFNAKELPIVVNVGCLVAGVDWDVRCIVLARPTRSKIFHVQSIGRGLRTADGKDDCLILDHAGNNLRLGFVTDIHTHEMNDGKRQEAAEREKQTPLPKECPKCSFLKPAKVRECPSCSHAAEVRSDLEEADGELVEMTSSTRAKAKVKPKEYTRDEKQAWYAALATYAFERDKSEGWIAHTYRAKFGVWPRGLAYWHGPKLPEVLAFIRHRNIAYARSRQRGAHRVEA